MIKVNEVVNEMDLGDQVILEVHGKTLGLNRTGREIYLKIKEGRVLEEISAYMEEIFGCGNNYMNDIQEYVHKMKEFGIVQGENND